MHSFYFVYCNLVWLKEVKKQLSLVYYFWQKTKGQKAKKNNINDN